jgi:ABC-type transport system substrate-binding protein
MREKNPSTRSDLFEQCDQQIIDDAVVMPIYHAEFMTMVNNKIKNFHANSTEIIDFSSIFIRDTDQE